MWFGILRKRFEMNDRGSNSVLRGSTLTIRPGLDFLHHLRAIGTGKDIHRPVTLDSQRNGSGSCHAGGRYVNDTGRSNVARRVG
jgi:hypothetical protein